MSLKVVKVRRPCLRFRRNNRGLMRLKPGHRFEYIARQKLRS